MLNKKREGPRPESQGAPHLRKGRLEGRGTCGRAVELSKIRRMRACGSPGKRTCQEESGQQNHCNPEEKCFHCSSIKAVPGHLGGVRFSGVVGTKAVLQWVEVPDIVCHCKSSFLRFRNCSCYVFCLCTH